MKKLLLGVLLLASLATPATARPAPARAPAGYQYAYAYRDCAPWDGAALSIILENAPIKLPPAGQLPAPAPARIVIRLWHAHPPLGRWIGIPGASRQSEGALSECTSASNCQSFNGRVRVSEQTGSHITGEARFELPDHTGRELVFPFSAPILPYVTLCG